jgi:hypothetical protein
MDDSMKPISVGTIVFSNDPVINNCRPDLGIIITIHDGAYTVLWQTDLKTTLSNSYVVEKMARYCEEWIIKNLKKER